MTCAVLVRLLSGSPPSGMDGIALSSLPGPRSKFPSSPAPSTHTARQTMRANRRRDTKPELQVRRRLHASGLRYRVDLRVSTSVATRPDIVFTRRRVAVFIDGCFWHSCPVHGTRPAANADYWTQKLARNHERDIAQTAALTSAGWRVLRFWEHEDASRVAEMIEAVVRAVPPCQTT